MNSSGDSETCVLVLNNKNHSNSQHVNHVKKVTESDPIASVIVKTETNRFVKKDVEKQTSGIDSSDATEGIDMHVPLLTSIPKDLTFDGYPNGIFQGYVHTMKAVKKLKDRYETQTSSRFILYARNISFGDGDWMMGKHRVAWEISPNSRSGISLPFQGNPFFVVGHSIYDCQHGIRRKPSKISKKEAISPESLKKRKTQQHDSIKIGCPAQLLMREVIMFPEFKLSTDTHKRRQLMSKRVRKGIQLHNEGKDMIQTERRIYLYFPRPGEHLHQDNNARSNNISRSMEPVDPKIVEKIHTLVKQGMTGTKKIRGHVDDLVSEMFQDVSPPHPLDRRRYNPSDQDIRNVMKKARAEMKKAKRKSLEVQCTSFVLGIREQLQAVKSEKYLIQLRDHLSYLHGLVKKEESIESLLTCHKLKDDPELLNQSPQKKLKSSHSGNEENSVHAEITSSPHLPSQILKTEGRLMEEACSQQAEDRQTHSPDRILGMKQEQIVDSLIEISDTTGTAPCVYLNEQEHGEGNQIVWQGEVPQNHEGQIEGMPQIYYYEKIHQGDLFTVGNQANPNLVTFTELVKENME